MIAPKSCLRPLAIAAFAAFALSLPSLSGAQAAPQPDGTQTPAANQPKPAAKPHSRQATTTHRNLYGAVPAREPAGCTWPYKNQFPPCQSTWPAGDPNYHGARPGPTFPDEN